MQQIEKHIFHSKHIVMQNYSNKFNYSVSVTPNIQHVCLLAQQTACSIPATRPATKPFVQKGRTTPRSLWRSRGENGITAGICRKNRSRQMPAFRNDHYDAYPGVTAAAGVLWHMSRTFKFRTANSASLFTKRNPAEIARAYVVLDSAWAKTRDDTPASCFFSDLPLLYGELQMPVSSIFVMTEIKWFKLVGIAKADFVIQQSIF